MSDAEQMSKRAFLARMASVPLAIGLGIGGLPGSAFADDDEMDEQQIKKSAEKLKKNRGKRGTTKMEGMKQSQKMVSGKMMRMGEMKVGHSRLPKNRPMHTVAYEMSARQGTDDHMIKVMDKTAAKSATFEVLNARGALEISAGSKKVRVRVNPDNSYTVDGKRRPDAESAIAAALRYREVRRGLSPEMVSGLQEAIKSLQANAKAPVASVVVAVLFEVAISLLVDCILGDDAIGC